MDKSRNALIRLINKLIDWFLREGFNPVVKSVAVCLSGVWCIQVHKHRTVEERGRVCA